MYSLLDDNLISLLPINTSDKSIIMIAFYQLHTHAHYDTRQCVSILANVIIVGRAREKFAANERELTRV